MNRSIKILTPRTLLAAWVIVAGATALGSTAYAIDFSLDGKDDALIWNSGGVSIAVDDVGNKIAVPCGSISDIPLAGRLGPGGTPRFAYWRPGSGTSGDNQSSFYTCLLGGDPIKQPLGAAGDQPFASMDFDGDAKDDLATWRPRTGEWQLLRSSLGFSTALFGLTGDIPTPCDFDGDLVADLSVFRPATGEWFIKHSSDSTVNFQPWGLASDVPVPGDYDGDGQCDITVYRPENSTFYVIPSGASGGVIVATFGLAVGVPLRADINGDGASDFVLLKYDGTILTKTSPSQSSPTVVTTALTSALPINASRQFRTVRNDFDGDGKSDLGVIRELVPGLLYWLLAHPSGTATEIQQWGLKGDRLAPRDYDGDLRSDVAVIRSINGFFHWFIKPSSGAPVRSEILGTADDAPIAADYDGDGKSDLAVVRLSNSGAIEWFVKSSLANQTLSQSWGLIGDYITTGEFIRPGMASAVAIRPALGGLTWYVRNFDGSTLIPISWGLSGDRPAPADYDGDGRNDFAVIRNSNGLLVLFVRTASGVALAPRYWGLSGDIVVPARYGNSLKDEPAVWRSEAQAFYAIADSTSGSQIIPWGLKGDRVIPTTESYASSSTSPTPQAPDDNESEFSCTSNLAPIDGGGGFVHKPVSDSDGKLVVVLPSRYAGQTTRMELGSKGKIIDQGRFAGINNGNRPHFRFKKSGGSYPAFMVEIAYLNNGERICYTIPTPSKRYD